MRRSLLFVIALALGSTLHAQPIARGEIVDKIAAAVDPEMTYAVYLPAAYNAERRWPVVFVMDPRRRGAFAADLFREAAAEYGWIVISSNNSESDSDTAPNGRALRAMLIDAQSRFSLDEKRVYLTGFSGTANFAFASAENIPVAGVIGCSGWLPPSWKARDPGFAWFGTAGDTDFNYLETKSIDERIGAGGGAHRFEWFTGPHRWAPKDLLGDAVSWMELQAMKRRTRTTDPSLVAKLLARDVAAAQAEADPLRAMRRYESIARTFDGLADVAACLSRADELRRSKEVSRALDDERNAIAFENSYRDRLPRVFNDFLQRDDPLPAAGLAQTLGLSQLQKVAKEPSYRGTAAQRVLEAIYGQVAFYLPQQVQGPKLLTLKNVA
ncbi:MAG: hypothetical protein ACXVH7_02965, partial [Thermoanaerobaculia bacterium]